MEDKVRSKTLIDEDFDTEQFYDKIVEKDKKNPESELMDFSPNLPTYNFDNLLQVPNKYVPDEYSKDMLKKELQETVHILDKFNKKKKEFIKHLMDYLKKNTVMDESICRVDCESKKLIIYTSAVDYPLFKKLKELDVEWITQADMLENVPMIKIIISLKV